MSRVSRDVVESRPDEIVEACRQLYQNHTFHEITLKDISDRTSLSRPSIYNYFATKEEIFLALLKKEYGMWADDLEAILGSPSMDASYFSQVMAAALDRRHLMLRIQCMDLYEIGIRQSDTTAEGRHGGVRHPLPPFDRLRDGEGRHMRTDGGSRMRRCMTHLPASAGKSAQNIFRRIG